MKAGSISHHNGLSKALILIGLILTGGGLSYFVSFLFIQFYYGLDVFANPSILTNFSADGVIPALKFMQLMNSLGAFIIPPLLFAFLVSENWKSYLAIDKRPDVVVAFFVIALMVLSQPWINFMVWLNESMTLPDFLSTAEHWMKDKEKSAELITESFLTMNGIGDLAVNILLIGFVAALGEELFFRGLIQPYLFRTTRNIHLAIWLTAILFSAIHVQFYGFLPRMILGAIFGYALYWTGSLWVPVLAHFVNNAGAVVLTYIYGTGQSEQRIETIGIESGDWTYLVGSGILIVYALIYIRNSAKVRA
ncbi:MAG TPA: CPBP family intramembrane metalloprotease [Flavobacteriales bacterium]|nr:CPBP family intramembrane metalloprotease [Flavobacteriales bacterium]